MKKTEIECPNCLALLMIVIPSETTCHGCRISVVVEWVDGVLEVSAQ